MALSCSWMVEQVRSRGRDLSPRCRPDRAEARLKKPEEHAMLDKKEGAALESFDDCALAESPTTGISRRNMILGGAASVALIGVPRAALAQFTTRGLFELTYISPRRREDEYDNNERWSADLLQGLGQ